MISFQSIIPRGQPAFTLRLTRNDKGGGVGMAKWLCTDEDPRAHHELPPIPKNEYFSPENWLEDLPKNTCFRAAETPTLRPRGFRYLQSHPQEGFWAVFARLRVGHKAQAIKLAAAIFPEADLNEAALRRTLSRVRSKGHGRIWRTRVEGMTVSRYDNSVVSFLFMVEATKYVLKVAPQVLFFPTTSGPKSIEIP